MGKKIVALFACFGFLCPLMMAEEDYPLIGATWNPAHPNNYTVGRGGNSIRYIIIHVVQGSYNGCISWFKNPSAKVSAHYVVSKGGSITQMVRDSDTGWHAGNWSYNQRSIGIEHEGYVSDPSFPDSMYRSSAALVRHLCNQYGIPKDRQHVIGHNEVPGATHTDPGPHWDWGKFMSYVKSREVNFVVNASAQEEEVPLEEYKIKVTGTQLNLERLQKTVALKTGEESSEKIVVANLFDTHMIGHIPDIAKCLSCDCHAGFPEMWSQEIAVSYISENGSTADLIYVYDRYDCEIWVRPIHGGWQKLSTSSAYEFKGYRVDYRR